MFPFPTYSPMYLIQTQREENWAVHLHKTAVNFGSFHDELEIPWRKLRKAGDVWIVWLVLVTWHQIVLWVQNTNQIQVEWWGWDGTSQYTSEYGCLHHDTVYHGLLSSVPTIWPLRCLVYKHNHWILQFHCEDLENFVLPWLFLYMYACDTFRHCYCSLLLSCFV